jgi:hypothetical protein
MAVIIITGIPISGHNFYGPFDTADDAIMYQAKHLNDCEGEDWWVAPLVTPEADQVLPLHYPGAAIPIPEVPYTHVHKLTGELVTVTGHVNGITIFDSPIEDGEELLDEVFAEQYESVTP